MKTKPMLKTMKKDGRIDSIEGNREIKKNKISENMYIEVVS